MPRSSTFSWWIKVLIIMRERVDFKRGTEFPWLWAVAGEAAGHDAARDASEEGEAKQCSQGWAGLCCWEPSCPRGTSVCPGIRSLSFNPAEHCRLPVGPWVKGLFYLCSAPLVLKKEKNSAPLSPGDAVKIWGWSVPGNGSYKSYDALVRSLLALLFHRGKAATALFP